MRSRYDLAETSTTRASNDTFFPDIMTIPMNKFQFNTAPVEYYVNAIDRKRTDLMMQNLYGMAELDYLLLWINTIEDPTTLTIGQKLLLPSKTDLETFYYGARE